jgi:hypothetical protein
VRRRICIELFTRRGYLPDWRKRGIFGLGWYDPENPRGGFWLRVGTRFVSYLLYEWEPETPGERPPPVVVRSVPWRLFVEAGGHAP